MKTRLILTMAVLCAVTTLAAPVPPYYPTMTNSPGANTVPVANGYGTGAWQAYGGGGGGSGTNYANWFQITNQLLFQLSPGDDLAAIGADATGNLNIWPGLGGGGYQINLNIPGGSLNLLGGAVQNTAAMQDITSGAFRVTPSLYVSASAGGGASAVITNGTYYGNGGGLTNLNLNLTTNNQGVAWSANGGTNVWVNMGQTANYILGVTTNCNFILTNVTPGNVATFYLFQTLATNSLFSFDASLTNWIGGPSPNLAYFPSNHVAMLRFTAVGSATNQVWGAYGTSVP